MLWPDVMVNTAVTVSNPFHEDSISEIKTNLGKKDGINLIPEQVYQLLCALGLDYRSPEKGANNFKS